MMKPLPAIVGLGEVLWDVFPDGARFGGAPANFACSAAGLGRGRFDVAMASAVGVDELGRRAIAELVDHQVSVAAVAQLHYPTGQVHVRLNDAGQASYEFVPDTAWDRLDWSTALETLAKRTDIVCFGTLGQRSKHSLATIRRFIASTCPSGLRILDINLRPPFVSDAVILDSLRLANVLKLNDEELPVIARLLDLTGSPSDILQQLTDQFAFHAVALTRGAHGAILVRGNEISEAPGIQTDVVDTVGAGDAFTAAFAIGLLDGRDLDSINRMACEVAAFVCSQSGATPQLPDRFSLQA